jgi:hypothetical protein
MRFGIRYIFVLVLCNLCEEFMEPAGISAYALARWLDVPLPQMNQPV